MHILRNSQETREYFAALEDGIYMDGNDIFLRTNDLRISRSNCRTSGIGQPGDILDMVLDAGLIDGQIRENPVSDGSEDEYLLGEA